MKIKKNLIVGIAVFCVAALVLYAIPVIGQTGEYDPWLDTNDDGYIGIDDLFTMAEHFGAEGEPINKTELLLQLLSRLDELNTTVTEQQNTIDDLSAAVIALENTKLGAPDYDSGWMPINPNQQLVLIHGLKTADVIVYIIGRDSSNYIHQYWYGGDLVSNRGAYWYCPTPDHVIVFRLPADTSSQGWREVRVMIWRIPSP